MTELKMKELESRSGVSREAIRFYIREGILPEPIKPKKNVALYSEEHLIKLRLIRKIQDEKFLPLREIKNLLEDADLSQLSANSELAEFEAAFHHIVNGEQPEQDLTIEAASDETGFSVTEIQALHEHGTIFLQQTEDATTVVAEDVAILKTWAAVRSLGFEPQHGFDFQLLARFAESVQAVAELELDLFLNAYGNLPTEASAQMGASGLAQSNRLLQLFHTRAINRALASKVKGEMPNGKK